MKKNPEAIGKYGSRSRWTINRHRIRKSTLESYLQNEWSEENMETTSETRETREKFLEAIEGSSNVDDRMSIDISLTEDGLREELVENMGDVSDEILGDDNCEIPSDIDDPFAASDESDTEDLREGDFPDVEDNSIGEISEREVMELRLLRWKIRHNISDNAFDELSKILATDICNLSSLYINKTRLKNLTGIESINVDCCINSCVAYTGTYATLDLCPHCNEPRLTDKGKPRKRFNTIPLIPRLKLQYKNAERARELRYRAEYVQEENRFADVFDGSVYKQLCHEGFFAHDQDVALGISTDGFQIFRQRTNDCWPILIINYNIDPTNRVKRENLLLYGVIPGPKQPKEIASFLRPLIDELKILESGVEAYDGATNESFLLKAHLLLVSGDIPAIAKIGCFKGSNGLKPCRFCDIKGILQPDKRHYYYPLDPPEGQTGTSYRPDKLPMRTHTSIMETGREIENAINANVHNRQIDEYSRATGITGTSIFTELKTFRLPAAFPVDFMHLIFENTGDIMYKHWSAAFFGNSSQVDPYIISADVWKSIGENMSQCRRTIPSSFGRPPRDIIKHVNGWKAEEWQNWIVLYSMPLLISTAPPTFLEYLHGWASLVRAVQLCLQPIMTGAQVQEVRQRLTNFVRHYESVYYRREMERLSACTSIVHYLLHIADSIEQFGPVTSYWQYPMERICGQLGPLVKSAVNPYQNLANNIILMESLNHVGFACSNPNIFKEGAISNIPIPPTQVLSPKNYIEELYGPCLQHNLLPQEKILLRQHYGTIVGEKYQEIELQDPTVLKYSSLRTKDGHLVRSRWSLSGNISDLTRNNSRIIAKMQVDRLSHRPSAIPEFETRSFYGEVQYFFAHFWRGRTHMMAMVRFTPEVSMDAFGMVSFPAKGRGPCEVVDVETIDRLAGWMTLGSRTYIIDEEAIVKIPARVPRK